MTDLFTEMNWTLIVILVIVSAVVAYIGDLVGMRVGKKRVSIFGLRPKSTSSIITVVSGILITILTLAVLSTTSQTVRTAIFSMKFVQRQITDLTSQLQEAGGNWSTLRPGCSRIKRTWSASNFSWQQSKEGWRQARRGSGR